MTAFALKIIAAAAMLIDHLGAVFPDYFPETFRFIGRMAFPLFVYLIAEGCRHTRSMPKYLLRLFIFTLISEIPFDLVFNDGSINFLRETNVFYTLFLGVLAVYAHQKAGNVYLSAVPLFFLMYLAHLLDTDYAAFGVAFIFTMYVIPQKTLRLAAMTIFCLCSREKFILGILGQWIPEYSEYITYVTRRNMDFILFCLLSVPLAALYNEQSGTKIKWMFYWYYPGHLAVLAWVKMMV